MLIRCTDAHSRPGGRLNLLFLTCQGGVFGSTLSIAYLCKGLAKHGHAVCLGLPPGSLLWKELEESAVERVPMRFRGKFDSAAMRAIRDVVRTRNIDIINAQSSLDRYNAIFARWRYRLAARLVHTRRQMPRIDVPLLQAPLYYLGADRIVAVSSAVKRALVRRGIPHKHITVIHNGTPPEKYDGLDPAEADRLRARYGITPGDRVIGCVSRRKRQEQILQALRMLDPDIKVMFVGMSQTEKDRRIVRDLGIANGIHYVDTISPAQVLYFYGLFSVMVLPSITEGLSQALLEAMSLRVPVVAIAAGGNTDLIEHGVNGMLFENDDIRGLADCVRKALDSGPHVRAMVDRAARDVRERFSMQRTVREYETFFGGLLDTR
ncbi:MAG: glycosyltransferase [Chitinivibrionales bacterium]|nr:glycosyltransferase [Chitinivibrionales bacterium]MBD3394771.1 glycosyltransferase [Chitinivibrionales bacterium]